MNTLFFISAYKKGSTWLFDDERRGIIAEPFVCGASQLIDKYLIRKGNTSTQDVPLLFSTQPMPGYDVVLNVTEKNYPTKNVGVEVVDYKGKSIKVPQYVEDKEQEPNSAWYVDQEGDECWLCPAQIKFFGRVADVIYAKIG